jgi:hypothetical protein
MSNESYPLLITHYFKIKDSWSRGFSEKRGRFPWGDAKGDSASAFAQRLVESVWAKPQVERFLKTNPNSTDTTCFAWGLKPLNLR